MRLMEAKGAEIAFSPGFRWGTSLLPGEAITLEQVMNQTAITYPDTTVTELTGAAIKSFMEDVCDNLFHPDPYYQQGGDMVRVGGMSYSCTPGDRRSAPASATCACAGGGSKRTRRTRWRAWAPVADGAAGEPIWEVLARYLRDKKVVKPGRLGLPRLIGTDGQPRRGAIGTLKARGGTPIASRYNRRLAWSHHADLRISLLILRVPEGIPSEDQRPGHVRLPGVQQEHFLQDAERGGFQARGQRLVRDRLQEQRLEARREDLG